jgi:putative DNA primase/helicase
MVLLHFTKSFEGKEDLGLRTRLAGELPGILNWSLDGLDRLSTQGSFTAPKSAEGLRQLMGDVASPVKMFVEEQCITDDPDACTQSSDVYSDWKRFADTHGFKPMSANQLAVALNSLGYPRERPRSGAEAHRPRQYRGLKLRNPVPLRIPAEEGDPI